VFSTRDRLPKITPEIQPHLFEYIGGICNNLSCQPIIVGGHTDHIHILNLLAKNITVPKLLQELKGSSSLWIKTKGDEFQDFYWQEGYGVFSVDSHGAAEVKRYIQNQGEHHKKKSFKEEFVEILKENEVEYDERYLWN
jgi:putative transposase